MDQHPKKKLRNLKAHFNQLLIRCKTSSFDLFYNRSNDQKITTDHLMICCKSMPSGLLIMMFSAN